MKFADTLAEDRRLIILRALLEDHDYALNEGVLKAVLRSMGHSVTGDMLRGDVQWLVDQRLVRVEEIVGATEMVRIVRLAELGGDVARGHPHPGVARPSPR